MEGLRRLALILGFLGWVTLAYALVVILAHDGTLVIVDSLGPWEPWLDVVAVVFAISVTGTALVREYRAPRRSMRSAARALNDPHPPPPVGAGPGLAAMAGATPSAAGSSARLHRSS